MKFPMLHSAAELEALVDETGFLPFFKNEVPGFSVQELTPPDYWFVKDRDGPWEWKGMVAAGRRTAYAKLFNKRAGYVSQAWYPDLANYRRDGYDFDSRCDEGIAPLREREMMAALSRGSLLSWELAAACGYGKDGSGGFEPVIVRLQMQTYVTIQGFEYKQDRRGRPLGWGSARYVVTEDWLGAEAAAGAYDREPGESRARILEHLARLLPEATEKQLNRLIRL